MHTTNKKCSNIRQIFLQSTNTEENTDATETNFDLAAEYEENEDGSKLGRLFFTVFHKLLDSLIPKVLNLHFRVR